jgi:hypothetical protein
MIDKDDVKEESQAKWESMLKQKNDSTNFMWPTVDTSNGDWCGEYKPKKTELPTVSKNHTGGTLGHTGMHTGANVFPGGLRWSRELKKPRKLDISWAPNTSARGTNFVGFC